MAAAPRLPERRGWRQVRHTAQSLPTLAACTLGRHRRATCSLAATAAAAAASVTLVVAVPARRALRDIAAPPRASAVAVAPLRPLTGRHHHPAPGRSRVLAAGRRVGHPRRGRRHGVAAPASPVQEAALRLVAAAARFVARLAVAGTGLGAVPEARTAGRGLSRRRSNASHRRCVPVPAVVRRGSTLPSKLRRRRRLATVTPPLALLATPHPGQWGTRP